MAKTFHRQIGKFGNRSADDVRNPPPHVFRDDLRLLWLVALQPLQGLLRHRTVLDRELRELIVMETSRPASRCS